MILIPVKAFLSNSWWASFFIVDGVLPAYVWWGCWHCECVHDHKVIPFPPPQPHRVSGQLLDQKGSTPFLQRALPSHVWGKDGWKRKGRYQHWWHQFLTWLSFYPWSQDKPPRPFTHWYAFILSAHFFCFNLFCFQLRNSSFLMLCLFKCIALWTGNLIAFKALQFHIHCYGFHELLLFLFFFLTDIFPFPLSLKYVIPSWGVCSFILLIFLPHFLIPYNALSLFSSLFLSPGLACFFSLH